MKKLLMSVLACTMLLGVSACGTDEKEEVVDVKGKTLKVVTAAPYEPYETMDEKGNLQGFDIDLGKAIATTLECELEWENLDFDGALLAVKSGQADMVMAGVSPTPERKESLDFSDIYYQNESKTANTVVTLKEKGYKTIKDLKGKTVGVQNGTIQQEAVESIADKYDLKVETRKEYADIAQEILNGKIDFMVCEKAMSIKLQGTYDKLDSFLLGEGEGSEGNVIGFKKGSGYTKQINKAIKELQKNGEMDKLIAKWFGE